MTTLNLAKPENRNKKIYRTSHTIALRNDTIFSQKKA